MRCRNGACGKFIDILETQAIYSDLTVECMECRLNETLPRHLRRRLVVVEHVGTGEPWIYRLLRELDEKAVSL